ncbi:carbohydrate kinase family protein, partial [Methanobacterium aggregans]|uniref:carbohydrate kinase family protein n=1 Tax=Methanobacterium aggregans TaxID=1615586 RepID=UPI00320F487E
NTIVGLSRLGLKAGFIGKVAGDREGEILLQNLQNEDVNTDGVFLAPEGRSGSVSGFVDEEGQRALYVDPGVNDLIEPNEVERDYINGIRVLHLTSFVANSSSQSLESQKKILNEIPEGVVVSFDPGMLYIERGLDFLEKFLLKTDILLINEVELKLLLNEEYETAIDACEEGSKKLLDYGIKVVVVKRGDKGAYVTDGRSSHFIDALKVRCVDTTGAGDAFNAGFIYGFIRGEGIQKSAQIGNFVAACSVQEKGATEGLPDSSRLEEISL